MSELKKNRLEDADHGPRTGGHHSRVPASTGPALSIAALLACVVGAPVGYFVSWPVGIFLIIASLVCAIVAIRKHASMRPLAILALVLDLVLIIAIIVVFAMLLHQINQMNELMGTVS